MALNKKEPSAPTTQVDIREKRAELYVSLHNTDAAVADYKAALDIMTSISMDTRDDDDDDDDDVRLHHHQQTASLYMYLGQLSTSDDALRYYQQGIDTLQQALSQLPDDNDQQQHVHQLLAAAYTSLAELYLTDLCFSDTAEQECATQLQQALHYDPDSIDALQTMASLRLCSQQQQQQQRDEAIPLVRRVYSRLQEGCVAMASLVGLHHNMDASAAAATELLALDAVQELPGFEFRVTTAKLLLECQLPTEAVHVIGSLLAENDQVVEIWVLAGDALLAEDDKDTALHYYERAHEMLGVIKENLMQEMEEEEDAEERQQQLDEVEVQLEELSGKIEEAREQDEG